MAVIAASRSLTQPAELARLHRDSVQRLIDRAVTRGLTGRSTEELRGGELGEKSFLRGRCYVSRITELQQSRVLEVVKGCDTAPAMAL